MRSLLYSAALAGLAALLSGPAAHAQGWGTLKGQVVWAGPAVPTPPVLKVDKDQAHCLGMGDLHDDSLLVDAKTKGVKNVMVWLAPMTAGAKLPINPALQPVPKQQVVIDQPRCQFEPRITMMREGQVLVVKNPSPVLHNAKIIGKSEINGTINLAIPAGQQLARDGDKALKAEPKPLLLGCDVHGWMAGRIGVFNHPYFALTKEDGTFEIKDAPAGQFKLYLQHEKTGWAHKGGTSAGQVITIKTGTNDLGKFPMKEAVFHTRGGAA